KIPALLTFSSYTGEVDSLTTTLLELEGRNLLQAAFDARLLKALLPTTSTDDELAGFWTARGARVRAVLQEELDVFRRAQPVAANVEPRSAALVATAVPSSADQIATAAVTKSAARMTRAALQDQIVALFAQAMEYPPEVFTEDVALEAELGIDSVKQMELLGKLEAQYSLPARPETFRLSDYGTLRKITDFVDDAMALADQFVPANAEGIANATVAAPDAKTVVVVDKSPPMSRAQLQQEIVILFAQAMEYPPEVFTEDVALEAELGIDSVKQMELLGKLEAQFHLPARPETFRLSDYGTLRKITDFVHGASVTSGQPNVAVGTELREHTAATRLLVSAANEVNAPVLSREELQTQIVALFAQAMEYPPEVFTEDVALEAELGIDSVKQMELLGKLEAQYELPTRPESFRLSDYGTLRKITDFVYEALPASQGVAQRSPAFAVG
ncbi:MAG: acyl carrier protein, partial [Betaproteobacteria bacterium]